VRIVEPIARDFRNPNHHVDGQIRVGRVGQASLSRTAVRRRAALGGSPANGAGVDTEAASCWTEFRSTVPVERCRACVCASPVLDRGRSRRVVVGRGRHGCGPLRRIESPICQVPVSALRRGRGLRRCAT
jgi:hypothetical protein